MARGENIFKRKDGRWEARYKKGYNTDHKIIYGYCYAHSYREAKEKVMKKKAELLSNPENTPKIMRSESISEFCNFWLIRHADSWKPTTLAKYEMILRKYIISEFGTYRITELDAEQITLFSYRLLHEKQLSAKTVRDILSLFHKLTADLSAWTNGAVKPVTFVYPKADTPNFRVLTPKEQARLTTYLSHEPDIDKFCVLLSLTTGLRIGEICGLRWENISLESRTITVQHTVQRIKNPDKEAPQKTILVLGTPKTRNSCRTIPLSKGMVKLAGQFSQCPDSFLLTGTAQYAEPRRLQRKLRHYTKVLDLPGVHFHTVRHTFATRCIEVGCDVKTLSELLGHASITMTMNRYVHPNLELKRTNIEKLEQAGFGCAVR